MSPPNVSRIAAAPLTLVSATTLALFLFASVSFGADRVISKTFKEAFVLDGASTTVDFVIEPSDLGPTGVDQVVDVDIAVQFQKGTCCGSTSPGYYSLIFHLTSPDGTRVDLVRMNDFGAWLCG